MAEKLMTDGSMALQEMLSSAYTISSSTMANPSSWE